MGYRIDTPPKVGPYGTVEQVGGKAKWRVGLTEDGQRVALQFFADWPDLKTLLKLKSAATLTFAENAGLTPDDIDAAARVGVMRAVAKFEPATGYDLSTYAVWWVRIEVQRAGERMSREYRLSGKRTVTADRLGASQDGTILDLQEAPVSPDLDPETRCRRRELARRVRELMKRVKPHYRNIFVARHGLADGCPRTLEETGQLFGISRERVRQIDAAVRAMLHAEFADLYGRLCQGAA